MDARLVQLPPIHVVMIRHTGPYEGIGPVFDQLWEWIGNNGVPATRSIGIYWDNPDETPADQLRSAACAEVPLGYQLGSTGGVPVTVEPIPGGDYVTTRFVGPYEDLAPIWSRLTFYAETTLGKTIRDTPAFEVYVNDPSDTPPDQLITELYMPV